MNFRQRNLKVFHQRLLVQRVLISIVVLNRLAELFRLTQIKTPSPLVREGRGEGDTSTFAFTYNTAGRRTNLTYPNGVTTNYSYDTLGQLTSLIHTASKGSAIASFSYNHDKVGNRLSKTEIDKKYTYSYDAIYRLLQSLPTKLHGKDKEQENKLAPEGLNQGAEIFTYDLVGNRLTGSKDKLNYSYNQGNQLTELMREKNDEAEKKTQYSYDNNGNLVKRDELDDEGNIKKTILYSYDYENRLVMVVKQDEDETKTISFKYDSFGRRIEKRIEEIEEEKNKVKIYTYVYDNEDIIHEYLTKIEDGKIKTETTRYIHGNGIDEPLAIEKKGDIYYYHADGLGSIATLTDKKQKVVESYEYSSFGEIKGKGDRVKNTYTFTGREWDKEIELYYYRARYYDPKIGRFIQKDPFPGFINLPQTLNPYPYVQNNPVNFIDPFGLYWEYSQSTTQLTYVDNQSGTRTPVGTGYSGQGTGLNNPNMQNMPNVGPIPQGTYNIGEPTSTKGPLTLPLTPQSDTNTFGRTNFLIHGDDPCRCQSASKGCIVLSPNIRNQIAGSGDNELRVVQ